MIHINNADVSFVTLEILVSMPTNWKWSKSHISNIFRARFFPSTSVNDFWLFVCFVEEIAMHIFVQMLKWLNVQIVKKVIFLVAHLPMLGVSLFEQYKVVIIIATSNTPEYGWNRDDTLIAKTLFEFDRNNHSLLQWNAHISLVVLWADTKQQFQTHTIFRFVHDFAHRKWFYVCLFMRFYSFQHKNP